MTLALLAMSHSPLLEFADLEPDVTAELDQTLRRARELRPRLRPGHRRQPRPRPLQRLLLQPDAALLHRVRRHQYRRLRQSGRPPDVPEDKARSLAEAVIAAGIDLAVSLEMEVDHGTVQPMEILYGDITAKPFIPLFINSVAPPFTP